MGELYLIEKKYQIAKFWYKTALDFEEDEKSGGFVDKSFSTIIPALQLTYIYYVLGDLYSAKIFHNKAKGFDPKNPSVLHNDKFFDLK